MNGRLGQHTIHMTRVSLGILPPGEVALIIAGIDPSRSVIDHELFGVAIRMTLIALIVVMPAFRGGRTGRSHPTENGLEDTDRQGMPEQSARWSTRPDGRQT